MIGRSNDTQPVPLLPGLREHSFRSDPAQGSGPAGRVSLFPFNGPLDLFRSGCIGCVHLFVALAHPLEDLGNGFHMRIVNVPVSSHPRSSGMGDGYALSGTDLLVEQLGFVLYEMHGLVCRLVSFRGQGQGVQRDAFFEKEGDEASLISLRKEDIAMAERKTGTSLKAEQARVAARDVIHVGHLLRIPQPVGPQTSLVFGIGAKIKLHRVQHVAIEVLERTVLLSFLIPTQFCVTVEIPPQEAVLFSSEDDPVIPNRREIGFTRRGFEKGLVSSERCEQGLWLNHIVEYTRVDLLADGAVVVDFTSVVGCRLARPATVVRWRPGHH